MKENDRKWLIFHKKKDKSVSSNSTQDPEFINRLFRHSWHSSATSNKNNTVKQRRSTEKLNELFTPNLISQAKASSSPSLTNDLKKAERLEFNILTDEEYQTANDNNPEIRRTVLQKVKRTITNLSNLKNKTGTNGNLEHLSDSQKTGIELLKCRTNKERNKVKQQRKDKCISGDSGIQVDDADGDYVDCVRRIDGTNLVRRTNSTKVNSKTNLSPVKIKSLRKQMLNDNEKIISTPLPIRSLSQPSGLDSITPANGDSDTESVISMNDLAHNIIIGEATDNFKAVGKEELSLERGDKVIVLKQEEGHWWYGHLGDQLNSDQTPHGWFPKDYIKIVHQHPSCELLINSECSSKDIKNCDILNHDKVNQSNEDGEKSLLSTLPIPNSKKIRDNCIAELIKTEITYVNLLSSICVGYIRELKKHPTVFSPQSLQIIFSNIEQIWSFQQKFLAALTAAVERNQIAQTFIEFQSGFFVYSTYCNSYSRALMELETFADNKQSSALFEKCRLAEKLPELPLSAHLLAPIQKICRYPLILNELVKHSDPRIDIITALRKESPETTKIHLDKSDCKEQFEIALTAMKQLTIDVNEGKRHSEHLATVQSRFDNFQGPPLSAHSSRFFIQMDAIRMSPNLWNNTYTLFLFDHQLVYCKKDLLKRSHTYKGRVFLDNCHVLNLPDGKIFGVTLKNALRIYCDTRHKWFDFCFRTSENKEQFLNALSIERQFCGGNFYISELPGEEDIQLSDRESDQQYFNETEFNSCNSVLNERAVDVEEVPKNVKPTVQNAPSPVRLKKADSLPKSNKNYSEDKREFSTNSLGRKRIGKWFRKAKSTNTTPSHSPTHQRHSMIAPGEGNQHGIAAEQIQPPNTTETIIASKIQEEAKAFNS